VTVLFAVYSGRKALDDMAEYLQQQQTIHDQALHDYARDNKLLLKLQSGVAMMLEKLKDIRLKLVSEDEF